MVLEEEEERKEENDSDQATRCAIGERIRFKANALFLRAYRRLTFIVMYASPWRSTAAGIEARIELIFRQREVKPIIGIERLCSFSYLILSSFYLRFSARYALVYRREQNQIV